jgi:hypothetical protein
MFTTTCTTSNNGRNQICASTRRAYSLLPAPLGWKLWSLAPSPMVFTRQLIHSSFGALLQPWPSDVGRVSTNSTPLMAENILRTCCLDHVVRHVDRLAQRCDLIGIDAVRAILKGAQLIGIRYGCPLHRLWAWLSLQKCLSLDRQDIDKTPLVCKNSVAMI